MSDVNIIIVIVVVNITNIIITRHNMWFETKEGKNRISMGRRIWFKKRNTCLYSGKENYNLRTLKECIEQTKLNLKIKITMLPLYLLH